MAEYKALVAVGLPKRVEVSSDKATLVMHGPQLLRSSASVGPAAWSVAYKNTVERKTSVQA